MLSDLQSTTLAAKAATGCGACIPLGSRILYVLNRTVLSAGRGCFSRAVDAIVLTYTEAQAVPAGNLAGATASNVSTAIGRALHLRCLQVI